MVFLNSMPLIPVVLVGVHLLSILQQGLTEEKELVTIGANGSREYFAEITVFRTWFEAQDFCNNSRMNLAEIDDEKQEAFLAERTNITSYYLWTAGRDRQSLDQFVWSIDPIKELGPNLNRSAVDLRTATLTCLAFSGGKYGLLPCTAKGHTLCDTPSSSKF